MAAKKGKLKNILSRPQHPERLYFPPSVGQYPINGQGHLVLSQAPELTVKLAVDDQELDFLIDTDVTSLSFQRLYLCLAPLILSKCPRLRPPQYP